MTPHSSNEEIPSEKQHYIVYKFYAVDRVDAMQQMGGFSLKEVLEINYVVTSDVKRAYVIREKSGNSK